MKPFVSLFARTLPTRVPWRIAFLIESGGLAILNFKATMAAILSFSGTHNRLVHDAVELIARH